MNKQGSGRSPVMLKLLYAIGFMLCVLPALPLQAHQLNQSYLYLDLNQEHLQGRFEITVADLNQALDADLPEDGKLDLSNLAPLKDAVYTYLLSRATLSSAGVAIELEPQELQLLNNRKAQYVLARFATQQSTDALTQIDVEYDVVFDADSEHRGFLLIENDWKTGTFQNEAGISLVFGPGDTRKSLDLSSSSVFTGLVEMVKLGMHHIWDGLDHLLFLFALLLPSVAVRTGRQWDPVDTFGDALLHVVKIVTVFTLAHTITLSAATLGAISLSPRIVESIIALSIAIAALDILLPVFRGTIWWVVFAFGLFHGFGFASVLAEIGIPSQYMLWSLLGFNLGVEIGQVVIVCILFTVLFSFRNSVLYVSVAMRAGALALILISLYWFTERAFLIDLPAGEYVNAALQALGLKEA